MGKTIRWLKGLFGLKKESNSGDRKNKIPSCIGGLRGSATNSPDESPLMKSVYDNNYEEDQNRRAIAVADVTAVAAEAAIAAAWAAATFVRITSHNRVTAVADRRNYAALKIQTVFRGYLARKALKALKSLVKLQALVRGYLVRKETMKTLNGMEALFRARSSVSEQRNRLQEDKFHSRRSFRRASETRSRRMSSSFHIPINENPDLIDLDFEKPKSRLTRANSWAWTIDQTPSPIFTNSHRLSIQNLSTHYEYEPHFSTTRNTPRFAYTCGPNDYNPIYERVSKDDTFTSDPNYMAKTQSFRAKVRSHSAPKQRPDYGFGLKKRAGPIEAECGPRVEKLKSKSPSIIENSFKNLLMSRIGKSKGQRE